MKELARYEMAIEREEDIVLVRRKVRELAQAGGFDTFAIAAVTTATSELSRNAWVHGGGGTACIIEVLRGKRFGLKIVFEDRGPGIDDLGLALRGGHSTASSLGLGLSGSRRLVDQFDIQTTGQGTTVTIVKWTRYS